MDTLQSIPVEKIRPSPHQARKEFDPEALQGLAESIRQDGLIQPITVRRVGDYYELISGERRLRAHKMLRFPKIEAVVRSVSDEGEAAAMGLIENLQREDLNPVEEAEGFQKLQRLDPEIWTHEFIATTIGISRVYVTQSLALLKLPESIQADVRRRTLTRSHGLELLRLPTAEQQLEVAKQIPDRLTAKETRHLVDLLLKQKDGPKQENAKKTLQDPLEDLWGSLIMNPQINPQGSWEVSYGAQHLSVLGGPKGPTADCWVFLVRNPGASPQKHLAQWFARMAAAVGGQSKTQQVSLPAEPQEVELTSQQAPMMASSQAELEAMSREGENLRLPKNPQEMSELEALADAGPYPVYQWIYGAASVSAQKVKGISWQALGVNDPLGAVRKMVESLKNLSAAFD